MFQRPWVSARRGSLALPVESVRVGRVGRLWPGVGAPPRDGLGMIKDAARPRLSIGMFFNRQFARSIATVSGLMFASDMVAQFISNPADLGSLDLARGTVRENTGRPGGAAPFDASDVDLGRAARMGTIGLLSAGPISAWTYTLCAHYFPGVAWRQVAKRLTAILVLNSPVSIGATFALSVCLSGGTATDAIAKIKQDLMTTWAANNIYWTPFLFANLRWIATAHQASVGAVAHAFWNVYLSCQTNKTPPKKALAIDES